MFYENESGWVRLNTTVVGSYLMDKRRLHVSAVLGHLQVISYSIINSERKHIYELGLPKVVLICVIQRDIVVN